MCVVFFVEIIELLIISSGNIEEIYWITEIYFYALISEESLFWLSMETNMSISDYFFSKYWGNILNYGNIFSCTYFSMGLISQWDIIFLRICSISPIVGISTRLYIVARGACQPCARLYGTTSMGCLWTQCEKPSIWLMSLMQGPIGVLPSPYRKRAERTPLIQKIWILREGGFKL